MVMEVGQHTGQLHAAHVLAALLAELGAVTEYRTLRDTLPRRLARLLRCRCVILYQRYGDTLQFVSGSFDEKPGWSSELLAATHINPVSVQGDTLEAQAWQQRKAVTGPPHQLHPTHVAAPLLYRMRGIGVLVAIRGEIVPSSTSRIPRTEPLPVPYTTFWTNDDVQVVEAIAVVVAMLLENTRLLERDRDRIQELALLNSISRQFHASLHDRDRVRNHIIQRTREISSADLCDCIIPGTAHDGSNWISPELQQLLLRHMTEQNDASSAPFIIERPGNVQSAAFLAHLDSSIKTFFAVPLWSGSSSEGTTSPTSSKSSRLLGMIVGGYYRPWKLRREETVLLSVLANQAGSVMENITLVEEVTAARNEARKLLRKVLDDQEEKRRLDRLATLGEMAANVAHEVRNPLASIKTSMQMLIDDLAHEPAEQTIGDDRPGSISEGMQESVSIVLKEVERLDAIVRDLLQFARPRQLHRVRCSLANLCDRVLQMIEKQYIEAGVIVHRLYHERPVLSADVAQIEQVLLNLCLNALHAMPDGGLLTISLRVVQRPGRLTASSSSVHHWVELSVNDTGAGMPGDQQERIFQPFFTTKAHGIGLGLPISRRLVEDHQGRLLVESQPGSGSTFIIRLPLDEQDITGQAGFEEEEA
jgi:signal transduction histidine kinase